MRLLKQHNPLLPTSGFLSQSNKAHTVFIGVWNILCKWPKQLLLQVSLNEIMMMDVRTTTRNVTVRRGWLRRGPISPVSGPGSHSVAFWHWSKQEKINVLTFGMLHILVLRHTAMWKPKKIISCLICRLHKYILGNINSSYIFIFNLTNRQCWNCI